MISMTQFFIFIFSFNIFLPFTAQSQGCDTLLLDDRALAKNQKSKNAVRKIEDAKGCASQADIDRLYQEIFAGQNKQTLLPDDSRADFLKGFVFIFTHHLFRKRCGQCLF